jgi:hypothetical protein
MSKLVPGVIVDTAKVRLGGNSPCLPARIAISQDTADSRKVRLGGNCPCV